MAQRSVCEQTMTKRQNRFSAKKLFDLGEASRSGLPKKHGGSRENLFLFNVSQIVKSILRRGFVMYKAPPPLRYTERDSKIGNMTRRHPEFKPDEVGAEAAQLK